jgi:hypothetical protein
MYFFESNTINKIFLMIKILSFIAVSILLFSSAIAMDSESTEEDKSNDSPYCKTVATEEDLQRLSQGSGYKVIRIGSVCLTSDEECLSPHGVVVHLIDNWLSTPVYLEVGTNARPFGCINKEIPVWGDALGVRIHSCDDPRGPFFYPIEAHSTYTYNITLTKKGSGFEKKIEKE